MADLNNSHKEPAQRREAVNKIKEKVTILKSGLLDPLQINYRYRSLSKPDYHLSLQ